MKKLIDIEEEIIKLTHECTLNGSDSYVVEMIHLGLSNGFNLAELKMFTAAKGVNDAQLIYDQIYSYHRNMIEDIICDCDKKENLEELLVAIENGERNPRVLKLIAESKEPYFIRCGFENGNKYTDENMYNMGYPTFDKAYINKKNKLPIYVTIEERGSKLN